MKYCSVPPVLSDEFISLLVCVWLPCKAASVNDRILFAPPSLMKRESMGAQGTP